MRYAQNLDQLISRFGSIQTRQALFTLLCALFLSSCHLMSTPEFMNLGSDSEYINEVRELNEEQKANREKTNANCSLNSSQKELVSQSFTPWWEGEWKLDHEALAKRLAQAINGDQSSSELALISVSLSQAFHLKIKTQQAALTIDGQQYRLATTPIRGDRGVRLIGGKRDISLWCEGKQAFWRAESGESFPIRLVE